MAKREKERNSIIIVIGGTDKAGKTSLLSRFIDDTFPVESSNDWDDYRSRVIQYNDKAFEVQIFDRYNRYRQTPWYITKAEGAIFLYDITNQESFEDAAGFIKEGMRYIRNLKACILIGTKSDLISDRVIQTAQGQALADSPPNYSANLPRMLFREVSAKYGTNIDEALGLLIRAIIESEGDSQCLRTESHSSSPAISPDESPKKEDEACILS